MNLGLLLLVLPLAGAVLMGVLKVLRGIGMVLWWVSRGIQQVGRRLVGGDWRVHATAILLMGVGIGLWTNTIGTEIVTSTPTAKQILRLGVLEPVTVAHLVAGAVGGGIAAAAHSGMNTILGVIRWEGWRT